MNYVINCTKCSKEMKYNNEDFSLICEGCRYKHCKICLRGWHNDLSCHYVRE